MKEKSDAEGDVFRASRDANGGYKADAWLLRAQRRLFLIDLLESSDKGLGRIPADGWVVKTEGLKRVTDTELQEWSGA